jgi:hypothetical protein
MSELSTMELPLLEPQDSRPITPALLPPVGTRPPPIRRYQHWWTELGRDTWTDIRLVNSGDGILWVPLYLVSTSLVQLVILISMKGSPFAPASSSQSNGIGCLPDGSFGDANKYDRWGLSGFFQITLRSGYMTFTQAKVVDITWDIVSVF